MKKQELIDYYREENEKFSFEKFFTDDDNDLDKRAIVVITPNQIVKLRTPLIDDNKRADHEPTYNNLTCTLYNIGFDNNDNLLEYKNFSKEYKDYIDYLQYNQNIAIIMCNMGVNHSKLIMINIPEYISSKQLELLEELEKEQKALLQKISKEKPGDKLVGFLDLNNKTINVDSFEYIIDYIKNNNIVNDNIPRLDEEIIFSKVKENNKVI